jgi:hypothetical protein
MAIVNIANNLDLEPEMAGLAEIERITGKFLTLHFGHGSNGNKINSHFYAVTIIPHHRNLKMFDSIHGEKKVLFYKTFKTVEELEAYHKKNKKIQLATHEDQENYLKTILEENKNINPIKEFDFRLFNINYSGYNAKKITKNAMVISGQHAEEFTITHVEGNNFEIDTKDKTLIDVSKYFLEYNSNYWVENPIIKFKKK